VGWEGTVRTEVGRSALRIRLVAIALGTTIVLLGGGPASLLAALLLAGYVAVAVAVRFLGPRRPAVPLDSAAIVVDALAVSGLVILLPLNFPVWALYLAPIATGALRYGPAGVLGMAALSVVGYDLALGVRSSSLLASDLWPVQLLLAAGLIVAELTWVRQREADDRDRLRRRDAALRELSASGDLGALLGRLTRHLVDDAGASGAWIWRADGAGVVAEHLRGSVPDVAARSVNDQSIPGGIVVALSDHDEAVLLAATFGAEPNRERHVAQARDLAADVRPLVNAAIAHDLASKAARARASFDAELPALIREDTDAGVLAAGVVTATAIAGPSAILRYADGTVLVGDVPSAPATALIRGVSPPAIVRLAPEPAWSDGPLHEIGARSAVIVALGDGLALVAASTRRLQAGDLALLSDLGAVLAHVRGAIHEREQARVVAVDRDATIVAQQQALRAKDEAVAAALHELRTPLSSVDGYAQLMSRHLDSARRQIAQLEHVLTDLQRPFEGPSTGGLDLKDVDLGQEVRDAASRLRLTSGADVELNISAEPMTVKADPARIAQVLDNVLGNAVKYSPDGGPVRVQLTASADELVVAVSDQGEGLRPDDLEKVFERGYRVPRGGVAVAGNGLGLAISKLIVVAHGGRIWAASDGPGRGSTFSIGLPRTP